jgi:hypothetical protein
MATGKLFKCKDGNFTNYHNFAREIYMVERHKDMYMYYELL